MPTLVQLKELAKKHSISNYSKLNKDDLTALLKKNKVSVPAEEKSGAKKSGAKKSGAKKSPAKKSPAKKSPAKKSGAKKSPAKKSGAKKSPAKKSGAKKSSPKKKTSPKKKVSLPKSPLAQCNTLTRGQLRQIMGDVMVACLKEADKLDKRTVRLIRALEKYRDAR